MARKYETGLRYFSHDTNMAWDEKIRKLTKRFGAVGYSIFIRTLECIFKESYYAQYTKDFVFQILDSLNLNVDDETLVIAVINEAARVGLFDKTLFDEENVITSHGIQVRYFEAKKASLRRANRKNDTFEHPYLLVQLEEEGEAQITYQQPVLKLEPKIMPKKEPPKKKKEEPKLSEEEQKFQDAMKEHFPYVSKMEKPLTLDEYRSLCSQYGKAVVDNCIANLDNYKNIKNYRSAKATLNNWCKKDGARQQKPTNNAASLISGLRSINATRQDEGDDLPD